MVFGVWRVMLTPNTIFVLRPKVFIVIKYRLYPIEFIPD